MAAGRGVSRGGDGRVAGTALDAIGDTPAVFLDRVAPVGGARIVAKLEYFGPTGSPVGRACSRARRRA
jgi:cysteine synthase